MPQEKKQRRKRKMTSMVSYEQSWGRCQVAKIVMDDMNAEVATERR